jgi:CheY-like chemotaxis protein
VINDILDFSKIEARKLEIESFPFDLQQIIEEVEEMVAPKTEDKALDLVLSYPQSVPRYFVGDGTRVRQVVTNLAGNAVKFTAEGHVLISVECQGVAKGTAMIRISVQDAGMGIPAEKLALLFQKFSQVDGSSSRRFGGTGLGLAISKQLVELMGGSIGATSTVGQGSTFWFTLPLRLDTEPHPEPEPLLELQGLRILIVDDIEVNRRVLGQQIAQWGMRAEGFESAAAALHAAREAQRSGDPYQLAILDHQMPDLDGATLALAIKAEPDLQRMGIIFLSSAGQCGGLRETAGSAIDYVLVKPARQSQILDAIANAWARQSTHLPLRPRADLTGSNIAERNLDLSGVRVLVAEDNVVNQKVAIRLFKRFGIRADVAANGLEAIHMFDLMPYDLVFMDCQMPEMDGYTASREIRRQGGSRQVPIIAMTADATAGARRLCVEAGMDDYLCKPVKIEALFAILRTWAPQRGSAAPDPVGTCAR